MTDNEIIKALECCFTNEDCSLCPLFKNCPTSFKLEQYALSLINRQKAEIERYEKEHKENFDKWNRLAERTKDHYEGLYQDAKAAVRAEAIKEFAQRLKAIYGEWLYDYRIDNLVKEMVGADDG